MKQFHKGKLAIVLLSLIVFCLACCLFLQTDYAKYQLRSFGLVDTHHTNNTSTVSSWNLCLQQMDCDADVVFIGDSLTINHDFQADFPQLSVINLGLAGDSILDVTDRVYMLETVKPEKVFLMIGVNSLCGEKNIDKYFNQYVTLCNKIHETVPYAELYIQSLLPVSSNHDHGVFSYAKGVTNSFITRFNSLICEYAKSNELHYIDLFSLYEENNALNSKYSNDGLHIKEDSYSLWIDEIRPYVTGP